jgi:TRAP-type mannitol/chloroaromatic compound transport system permease large subunit
MPLNEIFVLLLFAGVAVFLLSGYPVAFCLAGAALFFGFVGYLFGVFDLVFFGLIPNRIFVIMTNEILIAVPLFVFMGVMLERSKVAEELLDTMGQLFGPLRGGLGISVCIVGALMAASTGIVGATVMTMGLLSLPVMLRRGYDPALACGTIAASGTLGQIIPPSIVLVVLGDQISNAYTEAQREQGIFSPDSVSIGDLFAGALIPGLILVGLYILYQIYVAIRRPDASPAIPRSELADGEEGGLFVKLLHALVAPVLLIVAVLGSILGGVATPTEGAAVGAVGATFLGGLRLFGDRPWPVYVAGISTALLLVVNGTIDLRVGREATSTVESIGIVVAGLCCAGIAWGLVIVLIRLWRNGPLGEVMVNTANISAMAFSIVIGAQVFSLVFRGLGGDDMVHEFLTTLPGGPAGAMVVVMLMMFLMGFFLDFLEITFVVVPIVAPTLLIMGFDPVWLGIMIAVNLQTSFLTPPFGFALFYMRGVAPATVSTGQIYRGVIPFVALQLLMLGVLSVFPELATWLPTVIYG